MIDFYVIFLYNEFVRLIYSFNLNKNYIGGFLFMRRLITEELSNKSQKFEDAIFSSVLPEEQFQCILCHGRFELEHDPKYEIKGFFSGKDVKKEIHINSAR